MNHWKEFIESETRSLLLMLAVISVINLAKHLTKPITTLDNWNGINFQYKCGNSYQWSLPNLKNQQDSMYLEMFGAHVQISKNYGLFFFLCELVRAMQ